jgi:hypothetical protein
MPTPCSGPSPGTCRVHLALLNPYNYSPFGEGARASHGVSSSSGWGGPMDITDAKTDSHGGETSDAGERPEPVDETSPRDLAARVDTMKAEIDALQIQVAEGRGPWYSQTANLVAILALIFSFGTTYVSYQHTQQQDVEESRSQLRELSERLSTLPREAIQNGERYAKDQATVQNLNASVYAELKVAASQAADIIERIPNDVSAAECTLVATQLATFGIYDRSNKILEIASERAKDAEALVVAQRQYAVNLFTSSAIPEGRKKYEEALNVFQRFPTRNQYFIQSITAYTELLWTESEINAGQCTEAAKHLAVGSRDGARTNDPQLLSWIERLKPRAKNCTSGASPNATSPVLPPPTSLP